MKAALKRILFGLLGKDPEAVVVTFLTGDLAQQMAAEIRELVPDRQHFTIDWRGDSAGGLWLRLRREFRGKRIALAPVLFSGEPEWNALRVAACFFAPGKILAYNARLERHHLKTSTWLASLMFLRGVPVDRIYLRPWTQAITPAKTPVKEMAGRALSADRRRVGVLSPYLPYPLSHGGAVRIFNLLREVAGEFDVFLFSFVEGQDSADPGPLLDICARVVMVPKPEYRRPRWSSLLPPEAVEYRTPEMRAALDRVMAENGVRALQVEYTALASYGGQALVEHDVTFDLFEQIHRREGRLASWWNLWRWRRFEWLALKRYRRVIAMSDKDAAMLGGANVRVIPNGVDLDRFQPCPETPGRNLLFIGSFRHFPNTNAYRFFTEQVWPLLRDRYPDMTLTVVAGPDPMLHWSAQTGTLAPPADERIRLLGFVSDVRPLYAEANLVLVPTTVSAGTNLKVLEAMAMERAVVSTTSGCAGLGLEHGRSVWVADSAADFAEGIARLIDDGELRTRIARAARALAEERFGWTAMGKQQAAVWWELLDE